MTRFFKNMSYNDTKYITKYGASLVVFYRELKTDEIFILIGRESMYVSDTIVNPKEKQAFIEEYETMPVKGNHQYVELEKANMFFELRAKEKSAEVGMQIKHDTPVRAKNMYKTNLRYLSDKSKYGVIKGHVEGNESGKHTIQRELFEEVGIFVHEDRINPLRKTNNERYEKFMIELTEAEVRFWKQKINEKNESSYGEMFNLEFVKMNVIKSMMKKDRKVFNVESMKGLRRWFEVLTNTVC